MDSSADRTATGTEWSQSRHWSQLAPKWPVVGPPLRPVAEDLGSCWDAVREWVRDHGAPRVLLLGVTPELYHLPWPEGTDLLAVDRTQAMIDKLWPGPRRQAHCADWLALTLPDGSRDLVLCDGGLHLLAYPQEQRRLAGLLRGVLSAEGLCILRLYVPPPQRESPDTVLEDFLAGRVSNLNVMKLRLGMALQESAAEGVELGAIWRAIHDAAGDLERLAERIGWPVDHMLAINTYRASAGRYHFVTVDQVGELFGGAPGGFEVRRLCVPSYELGERCPTIVLRRSARW